jgi:predicted metal-dependent hydrolase
MILKGLALFEDNTPQHLEVPCGEKTIRVAVKRDPRARRFSLRVSAATREVTLTMPRRGSVKFATEFAKRHSNWLAERVDKFSELVMCVPGAVIPLRGEPHIISHRAEARGTVWVETRESEEPQIIVAGREEHSHRRVMDFLKREARRDLDDAVLRHTQKLGLSARRIVLKDTTSRWGSCSTSGTLNFSWRLILAPSFVLDYLAAHEVTHLKEHNHSARYWKLLEMLYPDIEKAEGWLKRNGVDLHRYR